MDRDRNLLFGIFVVQLKQVTPTQLMEVAAAWAVEPECDLSHRLVEGGHLTERNRQLLSDLVDQAVRAHDGNATVALEAFGGEEQVHRSYRGSIVLIGSEGVSRATDRAIDQAEADPDSVPAVQETPGRYTDITEHGRGGMGRVLLVQDQHLGRDIALKELLPLPGAKTDEPTPVRLSGPHMARFLQEARITGQLEHPSVVPVYELGHRKDGTLYYTMKLVRGKTLAEAIRQCGSLKERLKLLPHFVDLCQAIAYAHSRGVIHRDIKPSNVMVGEFGETVVLDWGLAKAKDRKDIHADGLAKTLKVMNFGDEADLQKTQYGSALGTPVYMAPEQAKGELDQIDERSDVYSLGAVLYELLALQTPFAGLSVRQTLHHVVHEEPKPIRSIDPDVPMELVQICERAMRKDPEERYESAQVLAEKVQNYTPRPFYLNPWRPFLTDLVPELGEFPKTESRQIVAEARHTMNRNLKYRVGTWARFALWASLLISYTTLGLLFFANVDNAIHLRQAFETQRQIIRNLDGSTDMAPGHNRGETPICPFPWANALTDWTDAHKKLAVAFFYLGALVWLYLCGRFMIEWQNSILARYVREVLAKPRQSSRLRKPFGPRRKLCIGSRPTT